LNKLSGRLFTFEKVDKLMAIIRPKRNYAQEPVSLRVRCRHCGQAMPKHLVNNRGVCIDCEEPSQKHSFSRSIVNVAAVKSAIRRGEHFNGNVL
jgi:hypothetical protein